jgi:hypothetical protein
MGWILVAIVIVTLSLSLLVACIELRSGFMGDSSMVPGILLFGGLTFSVVFVGAMVAGKITITM